ncbi:MAG: diguanylate cyclase [Paracoccaceae bacterium]
MAGRILIVDAVATNRIILRVKLAAACYHVMQAETTKDALRLAASEAPDLVLLDQSGDTGFGLEVCRALRADPRCSGIPIVMTTPARDGACRRAAFLAGADVVLARPLDEAMLLARVRGLLRAAARRTELCPAGSEAAFGLAEHAAGAFEGPGRIAVIAPTLTEAVSWRQRIEASPGHGVQALAAVGALDALSQAAPELVLIVPGQGSSGGAAALRLLSDLQSRAETRTCGVLMIEPPQDGIVGVTALDLGLGDLIEPDVSDAELALRVGRQLRAKRETDRMRDALGNGVRAALRDPLTGLYNRRYALQRLERIARAALANGRPFAVMVLDIDRFKRVNDSYGHAAGDEVLKIVAERLRASLRQSDMVARIGGEEFLVVLPDTNPQRARRRAERLRRAVGRTPVVLPGDRGSITVTLSIGVALGGQPDAATTPFLTVEHADRALYTAKSDGRNQVIVSAAAT